jgi:hypothetical protein
VLAGLKPVGALATTKHVRACAADEVIVARAAHEAVIAAAAVQEIVAPLAKEPIDARAARQQVVARTPLDVAASEEGRTLEDGTPTVAAPATAGAANRSRTAKTNVRRGPLWTPPTPQWCIPMDTYPHPVLWPQLEHV